VESARANRLTPQRIAVFPQYFLPRL